MPTTKKKTPDREKGALKRTISKIKLAKKKAEETASEAIQTYEQAKAFKKVDSLEEATETFADICTYVSSLIGPDAPPENVADALVILKMVEKQAEAMNAYVRDAAIRLLKEKGQEVGEKGTRTLTAGNWLLEMHRKNGIDPKKLEKLLREKGLEPEVAMTPTIKYSVNYTKLTDLGLSHDTMRDIAFDESWSLQSPKHADQCLNEFLEKVTDDDIL